MAVSGQPHVVFCCPHQEMHRVCHSNLKNSTVASFYIDIACASFNIMRSQSIRPGQEIHYQVIGGPVEVGDLDMGQLRRMVFAARKGKFAAYGIRESL